jgi:hypothetical protein
MSTSPSLVITQDDLYTDLVKKNNTFFLDTSMPLYEDMQDIFQRKKQGKVKLFSDEEVWGE